jgi:signal transduction histidine kinase
MGSMSDLSATVAPRRLHGVGALGGLSTAGALAVIGLLWLVVRSGEPSYLLPVAVPLSWLLAAALGARTRTPRAVLVPMATLGALHLAAFAAAGWLGHTGTVGTAGWVVALLAQAAFGAGFVALARLLALYPDGRPTGRAARGLTVAGTVLVVAGLVQQALFAADAQLVVEVGTGRVPAPDGLPLGELPIPVGMMTPLLVVAGVVVLLVRARRCGTEERQRLGWAQLAAIGLALMLLATPAAAVVVPDWLWGTAFLLVVGTVPFLLVAGAAGLRLAAVDRYVVRLTARGLLVVTVLAGYALLADTGRRGWVLAGAATVAAALLGPGALRRLEAWADRWLTGRRVHRSQVLAEFVRSAATAGPTRIGPRTVEAVRAATGCAWCRLVLDGGDEWLAGTPAAGITPAVSVPLRSGAAELGRLDCGPRPRGWSRSDLAELDAMAAHAALALREDRLSVELGRRVEELAASRARLVRAEEAVRRQVERDLHDGVQQHLVALLAHLEMARMLAGSGSPAEEAIVTARTLARHAMQELRSLITGIHPVLLGDQGLVAAVEARVGLLPIEVVVDADPRLEGMRFAPEIEGAAFFVVSEALANVLKHSGAGRARVVVLPLPQGGLRVVVSDEGAGTASYDGSGLAGLRDRVDALGGTLVVSSTPGVGTTVMADLLAEPVAVR